MATSVSNERTDTATRMTAIAGSLAGICLLFISSLVGQASTLDLCLRISLYCFAGALPFAALAIVAKYKWPRNSAYSYPFLLAAIGVTFGIGAVLWHVDMVASGIYIGVIVLSIFFWLFFEPDKGVKKPN